MSDLAKNMAESFDKWLQDQPLKPLMHSQIVKKVEEMMSAVALLSGQQSYQQALNDAADRLHDVARWCKDNGFNARARHTDSAARRVLATPEAPAHLNPLGEATTCDNAERHIARLSEYLGEANDEIGRLNTLVAMKIGAARLALDEADFLRVVIREHGCTAGCAEALQRKAGVLDEQRRAAAKTGGGT